MLNKCVWLLLCSLAFISASNVVLLGDSLINLPWTEYGLQAKILRLLVPWSVDGASFNVSLINAGVNGNKISDILARTPAVLETYQPEAVIIFWDSDCSDVDESAMTDEEVFALRANYKSNVTATCSLVLESGASLALSGPEVLGEGPLFAPSRFRNKTTMLNDYRAMNQEVAAALGIPYIDMRAAFLDDAGDYKLYTGFDTEDGEHPNNRGSTIEAVLFAAQINKWLFNSTSPLYYPKLSE